MENSILRNEYADKNSNILPVIASFDSEGRIHPLYVRINGDSFKIVSSHITANYINTIEFFCKVIDREDEDFVTYKPLILTFYRRECVWATQRL